MFNLRRLATVLLLVIICLAAIPASAYARKCGNALGYAQKAYLYTSRALNARTLAQCKNLSSISENIISQAKSAAEKCECGLAAAVGVYYADNVRIAVESATIEACAESSRNALYNAEALIKALQRCK